MEQQTSPPPHKINDEAARRAKTLHFLILDLGGGGEGGLGFLFILCKIVPPCRTGVFLFLCDTRSLLPQI